MEFEQRLNKNSPFKHSIQKYEYIHFNSSKEDRFIRNAVLFVPLFISRNELHISKQTYDKCFLILWKKN